MNVEEIVDELVQEHEAIVSRTNRPKYLVYLDGIEYKLKSDEELVDFYKHFKCMEKYT